MKVAAWKYVHDKQLVFDGTFGICDSYLLLFIGMGINELGHGVPVILFLFSALTGNEATHASYDTQILIHLFHQWVKNLSTGPNGISFYHKAAITDTNTKEQGAPPIIWPKIHLLLCKFHVCNAWANRRKVLIKNTSS